MTGVDFYLFLGRWVFLWHVELPLNLHLAVESGLQLFFMVLVLRLHFFC
jgi:hypothetical protein